MISAKTHLYHTDNNPYEGFKLHGDIDRVFLRGMPVVKDGKVVLEKAGKYIKRGKKQVIISDIKKSVFLAARQLDKRQRKQKDKINFIYEVNEDETRSGCNGKTVSDSGCHDKESD